MPQKSGFTLIELLIVISIIGILSAIGLKSYQVVAQNGRDTQRQTDLKRIQSALQEYNVDQGYYPVADSLTPGSALTFTPPQSATKTYMNKIPADLKALPYYQYTYVSYYVDPQGITKRCHDVINKCSVYCLFASLENSANSKFDSQFCQNNKGDANFGVSPP